MGKKNYVLDTNVLIYEPGSLFMFEDNDLFITPVTLKELGGLKNREGEVGYSARRVKRILDELRNNAGASARDGIPLGEGLGKLYVTRGSQYTRFLDGMDREGNDSRILAAASWLSGHNTSSGSNLETILVTDDVDMRLNADLIGLKSQPFRNTRAKDADLGYTGRGHATVSHADMERLVERKRLEVPEGMSLEENEFLVVEDGLTGRKELARYANSEIICLEFLRDANGNDIHPFDAVPRNTGQRFMQEALLAPAETVPLAIIQGAAGTAKTFMALACGLEQTIGRHPIYKRVLITRANVEMDNSYGYLPGTEEEKVAPMMRPFMDNLEELMKSKGDDRAGTHYKDGMRCPNPLEYLFERGLIKAEAMQYMRGRSITDTFVIIDEAQNCTPNQILSIVSRIGAGSKIVLLGDPEQIDNKYLNKRNNGLVFAAKRFRGSHLCCQLTMQQGECVRSALAAEAAARLAPDYQK